MTVPFDPFAAEETGYSQEKFYTASYDSHGHRTSIRTGPDRSDVVSLKPHLAAAISHLRAVVPQYKTNQDVIRDFIVHGLHMRAEQMRGEIPSAWQAEIRLLTAIADLDRLANRRQHHELALQRIKDELIKAHTEDEKYEALQSAEITAMEMDMPSYIREASDLIEKYRR